MATLKRSELAGTWYAADPHDLARQVRQLLEGATVRMPTAAPLDALIVPHAGYAYSGAAAAAGYVCLSGRRYRRAVIVAPSHRTQFRGAALLEADAFVTPLGRVAIDMDGVHRLAREPLYHVQAEAFGGEHSLEIQLPLLQTVLPDLPVVPVLIGELLDGEAAALAAGMLEFEGDHTLMLISSDFVHYGWRFGYQPFPATDAASMRGNLRALDMGAIERVCAGDGAGFEHYVAETGATICGRNPIRVFLARAPGEPGQLLSYYTSLDVTGDYEHCVSYASIAFPAAARQ